MKKLGFFTTLILLSSLLLVWGCSSDDDDGDNNNPVLPGPTENVGRSPDWSTLPANLRWKT